MKTFSRLFCASLLLNALTGAWGQVNQTVNLGYATFTGSFNPTTNVTSFLGMRFAESPTGKLYKINEKLCLIYPQANSDFKLLYLRVPFPA